MDGSAAAPAAGIDGSAASSSHPWWERRLLELELGRIDDEGEDGDEGRAPSRTGRDWVVDILMFGYAATAALATVVTDRAGLGTALLVANALLAAVGCLALWARKRDPLGVAWLTVALSALSSGTIHAAQVTIFSAAIHARPRRAVEVTLAAIAATAIDCAIYADAHGRAFNGSLFAFWSAMTVAAFAFGSYIRVRRELFRSLQQRALRARAEQRLRVREARLSERTRIAREMHDVLAHRISLLAVHAGALEYNPDASQQELSFGLGVIRAGARTAQQELREVLGVLRTDPDGEGIVEPPQPTIAAVEDLVAQSREAGMKVTLEARLADRPLPDLVGRTAYRVVQEGLTNARKHAPTDAVTVSIAGGPGAAVELRVVNRQLGSGSGWVAPAGAHVGSGTGLVGLAERVALAGGTLEHGPRAGGGFELSATLPWPPEDGGSP